MLGVLLGVLPAAAQQQNARQAAIHLLSNTVKQYSLLRGMHINVDYYYTNESAPSVVLDSFKTVVVLNGEESAVQTPATETYTNSRYSVILFQEDQLMYLTKPVPGQQYHPLMLLDSISRQQQSDLSYTVTYEGSRAEVVISYPPGQAYKSARFLIDTALQYRLLCNRIVLKSVLLAPEAGEADLLQQGYDEYALLEVRFSGYQQKALPPDYFDEKRFFYKKEDAYVPAAAFSDYKIFVGNPNL